LVLTDDVSMYPLTFEPIFKEKVWGGRSLARLGLSLPADAATPIGEAWQLADLAQTAASGGGGGAERSVIANGPWAGQTLHEAIAARGPDLLGPLPVNDQGAFPLLVKFLDAQQNLSVQVHPSPEYAATHPEAHLKSEAWYIVDAEPGAVIYKGVREGVTGEQFRAAIEDDALEPLLIKVPVQPGDCHYLPSGTCHALGAGVVVAEVQTPSDTTFRVYDWGRTGRELHIEQAMQCIHFGPADVTGYEVNAPLQVASAHAVATRLVKSEYFRIDRYATTGPYAAPVPGGMPRVWMMLQGTGRIASAGPTVALGSMQTVLLPAGLEDGQVTMSQDAVWLEVTFPQVSQGLEKPGS
jgi:mannose-6-phosphate isomerase